MMAAQYAGTQMLTGIQEQQHLNQQLRGSFGHMNSMGGRGFTSVEMHQIGNQFRQMETQRGPGGEFVTMDELGRLASNMGRMGMAQGVRNAKEFQEKFQEMMKTVKEVATAFSTSLEEAQKIMSSMRGSGVFGAARQAAAGGLMRQVAAGGGLSLQEVSQIGQIGSQISRSIGGRGQAGFVAGMNTIGRVGAAVQSGVLSEEDIYNATGETGAAGRQAMATTMMQQEAQFFRSGLGRRVLASVAGKNGTIDPAMVQQYMMGGVTTGRTMQEAYAHLGQTGRANFIRNEGRLRGEAMAAFGGLGRAFAAKGWLTGHGMDIYNMDDRSMLFFQRKFKMDRDQADSVIKMARELGTITERQKEGGWEDQTVRELEMQRRHVGIEGVKRKFEDARAAIQHSLRQVGADFAEDVRDTVESAINSMTGEYVRDVEKNLGGAISDLRKGNITSANREFGGALTRNQTALVESVFGAQRLGNQEWYEKNKEAFAKAGMPLSQTGIGGQLAHMGRIQQALQEGYVGRDIMGQIAWGTGQRVDAKGKPIGAPMTERQETPQYRQLRSMMTKLGGGWKERLSAFKKGVEELPDEFKALKDAVALAGDVDSEGGREQLSRLYADAARGVEVKDVMKGFTMPRTTPLLAALRTTGQGDKARGIERFLFDEKEGGAMRAKAVAGAKKELFSWGNLLRSASSAQYSGDLTSTQAAQRGYEQAAMEAWGGMEKGTRKATAEYLRADTSIEIAETTLRGTQKERDALIKRLQDEQGDVGKSYKDMNATEQGQYLGRSLQEASLRIASGEDPDAVASSLNIPGLDDKQKKILVTKAQQTQQAQLWERDERRQRQAARRIAESYTAEIGEMRNLTTDQMRERLKKSGLKGKDLEAALKSAQQTQKLVRAGTGVELGLEGIGEGVDPLAAFKQESAATARTYHGMSTAQLEKQVQAGLATPEAAGIVASRQSFEAARRSGKKGAGLQALAMQLGGELDPEEAKKLYAIKDTEQRAAAFKKALGPGAEGLGQEALTQALEALRKGDIKKVTELTQTNLGDSDTRKKLLEQRQKKEDNAYQITPEGRHMASIDAGIKDLIRATTTGDASVREAISKKYGKGEEEGT